MNRALSLQWLATLPGVALDCVYPRWCTVCGLDVDRNGRAVCWDCRTGFALISDPCCARCGDPVDGMVEQEFECSWCRSTPVAFERARSAARYEGNLRSAILSLKYENNISVVGDLAPLLEACLNVNFSGMAFDAVTYVPLHPSRERTRTFNQARLLARELTRRLHGVRLAGTLKRTRRTASQTNLTARQRRENVRSAFEARNPEWIKGRTFLLVDDVMTTGATVNQCSAILKQSGAATVCVLTAARG